MFLCLQNVQAATIYINSSSGNDTTGDGTSGSPWKTFHKGYVSSTAGDTLDLTGTFDWSTSTESGDAAITGYTISKELTILGHGPDQTIFQAASAANTADRRVFTIAAGASTTISGVTIRYGYVAWTTYTSNSMGGAGISNSGDLKVINSELYSNYAQGCSYCSTAGYGGAIYNIATTTITGSALFSNTAYWGGGALVNASSSAAVMIVTNSSIYSNTNNTDSRFSTNGGGLSLLAGSTYITNCTIYGNTGYNAGGLYVNNASTTLYLSNTIVAGNTGGSAAYNNVYRQAGTITNNGYNIIGRSTNFTTTTGDWYDSASTGIYTLSGSATTGTLNFDTQVSYNDNALMTRTYALLTGSVAINNGTTTANSVVSVPSTDQRGATRIDATDIGAFEFNGGGLVINPPTTQVSAITITDNQYKQLSFRWTNGNGMRRVVFMKQASSGTAEPVDGTYYTPSTTFGAGSQIGTSGWYAVVEGYATSTTVTNLTQTTDYIIQIFEYNGVGTNQSVYLTSTSTNNPLATTTYTPITRYVNSTTGNDSTGTGTSGSPWKTFTKGYASSSPGDTLDVVGTFDWSASTETGDASITGFSISKDLYILGHGPDQTIFQASSTAAWGVYRRVFYITSGVSSTIQGVTIRNGYLPWDTYTNSSAIGGGGIRNDGNLTLLNSELTGSFAGGCLYCSTGYGGALYNTSLATVSNSSFYNNSSWYTGGAISNGSSGTSVLTLTNSTIYSNFMTGDQSASNYGAGVGLVSGSATITNCTVKGNSAKNGGGLYVSGASTNLYLKNTVIAGNLATTTAYNNVYKSAGTITNGGFNIVGKSTSYTSSTGDWVDATDSGTFTLYGASTTGTLGLDASAGTNYSLYGTRTFAITSASSIAVDRATSTANNGISIPSTDQRGAFRNSTVDIGAYEYGGTFEGTNYTLSYVAGSNGSISGSSTQIVVHAASGSEVTAVPNSGYRFVSWSDGATSSSRTDSNITATATYTASFAIDTVTLTYSAGAGGSISGSSTQIFTAGGNGSEVVAVPNTGYYFTAWSDGVLTAARTDTNVNSNLSATASFIASTNTINYIAGSGGAISGSSTQIISYGGNGSTVTATPSTGYSFTAWSDGNTTSSRYESNVVSNASYTASFTTNTYVLTYSTGAGGSLSGSTTQSVFYSASGSAVTAVPNTGYNFSNWSDGITDNPRTDTNVSSSVSVTANFSGTTNTINYIAGSGGSITGSSTQIISYGNNGTTVTATPSTGYNFVSWSDGALTAERTDNNVIAGATYIASFATNTYSINYSAGTGGTISGSATQTVAHDGSDSSVTAVPDYGYVFSAWSDDVTTTSRQETNVTSSRSFVASFSIDTSLVILSSVTSTISTSTAVITWVSNQAASSRVIYGPDTNYIAGTSESDITSRVTSHSVSLSGLVTCSVYHYKVISTNAYSATATSSDAVFTTTGCVGDAPVLSYAVSSVTSTGKTVTSSQDTAEITVVIPAGFSATTTDVTIQIKAVNSATAFASIGEPVNLNTVGSVAFDVKALIDEDTVLDSFDSPVTITMTYTAADVTNIQESTLWIYNYHSGEWVALSGCVVDTVNKSVTCSASSFSAFGLFGEARVESSNSGGGGFVPPSIPKINVAPKLSGNKIISDVTNVVQIAVSENENFIGGSWVGYSSNFKLDISGSVWYVKFRSKDGGESVVYKVGLVDTQNQATVKMSNKYNFKRDLKLGVSGKDVKELQKFLNSQGFLVDTKGVGSPGKESEKFGALTKKALIKFQKASNIKPASGIFGPLTRKFVNSLKSE